MVNMQTNRSPLETEPLTKLLFRYSVPTTLTLMVNYIYNIVDQIFVGQGVGITGMAAINIAFPLSILVNAVSLLLGDGCAANVSLCLGRREQENANKIFGQAVTWIVASGIALAFICGIFAPHIVTLFGTTNTAYGESLAYMRVIAIGIPFQLICPAFTAITAIYYEMYDGWCSCQYYSGSCIYFRVENGGRGGWYCHGDWRNGSRHIMSALSAQITICTA